MHIPITLFTYDQAKKELFVDLSNKKFFQYGADALREWVRGGWLITVEGKHENVEFIHKKTLKFMDNPDGYTVFYTPINNEDYYIRFVV